MDNKLTVSKLNRYIKEVFDSELVLHDIFVCGEISEYRVSGGNGYFTLKEGDSSLSCVRFSHPETIEAGTQVCVFGSVDFYRKSGKISFIARRIEQIGRGALLEQLQKRKETLAKEGLFANKLRLPSVILKVGVVTSYTGAVIHDVAAVLQNETVCPQIFVHQSRVQGEFAETELCTALHHADKKGYDVIIIARGGGSQADLDCFNAESVVRAVAALSTPSISAVGHEVDDTLCDLAATVRAGTPSIAAGIVRNVNREAENGLYTVVDRIAFAAKQKEKTATNATCYYGSKILSFAQRALDKTSAKTMSYLTEFNSICQSRYDDALSQVSALSARETSSLNEKQNDYERKVQLILTAVDAHSPLKLLSSGYTKTTKDGKTVSRVQQLNSHDLVTLHFLDGMAKATITEVTRREI